MKVKKLTLGGVLAALVFILTYFPKVPVPVTGGYIHLGDGAIFLASMLLGPLSIAAAAIGGTSMAGGRGNIFGTVIGAVLFSALKVGLVVMGVDTFYQYIVTGVVIIIAAYIEIVQGNMLAKKKEK